MVFPLDRLAELVAEGAQLQNRYDLAVKSRRRTTFTGTFLSPEKTVAVITNAVRGAAPDLAEWQGPLAQGAGGGVDPTSLFHESASIA